MPDLTLAEKADLIAELRCTPKIFRSLEQAYFAVLQFLVNRGKFEATSENESRSMMVSFMKINPEVMLECVNMFNR